jgi:hypothetical protein
MTRVYYYQERENSLLEGQNHIFLPPLKNWRKLLPPLVLVFLFRHLCSNVFKKLKCLTQTLSDTRFHMSLTLLWIDLCVSFLRYHIWFSIRLHVPIQNTLEHRWRNRKTRTRGGNNSNLGLTYPWVAFLTAVVLSLGSHCIGHKL